MADNTGELNALYKVAYAKGIEDLVPDTGKIGKEVDFVPSERQNGLNYEQPVIVTQESGFTYNLDSQDAFDLEDSVGMSMQNAIVPGNDLVLSSTIGYNQAARASHSATSFKTVMGTKMENMLKSSKKRLEIGYLYGNDSISTASQQLVATTDPLAIVFDTASWATGIWTGSENSLVVFSKVSDKTVVDSLKTFVVAKVNVDTKTVSFSAGTGSLANLETAIEAAALNVHFNSSVSNNAGVIAYKEQAGLKKIFTNTGSLFNIDASVYDLWKGNTFPVTGQLTMSDILNAVAQASQRGLDEDASVYVNPDTWADLATDLAALRVYDSSYSEKNATNGSQVLKYVSQNGVLSIVPYNIVKAGDCFIFPPTKLIRIGARDLSFTDPTRGSEQIFFTIPGKAGVGLRTYTNQAIFCEAPAQCTYVSGIVNSND